MIDAACVTCPAGQLVRHERPVANFCRVEGTVISEADQRSSLVAFCTGDYTQCPSFRAERDAQDQHFAGALARMEHEDRPRRAEGERHRRAQALAQAIQIAEIEQRARW